MLKLIVNNTESDFNMDLQTCKNTCSLYDPVMKQCGVFGEVNHNDENVYFRCQTKVPETSVKKNVKFTKQIERHAKESSEPEWYTPVGINKDLEDTQYPGHPDLSACREDAVWYVNPSHEFGCWIINKSNNTLFIVGDDGPKQGWSNRVYQSLIPLHDHKAPLPLTSKMCWYVDESGYGQYVLLDNGQVKMVTQPKPI